MIINITNRNDDKVADSLRERIQNWLESSQERYETITRAQVTIEKSERQEKVEATVHIAGNDIFAKAEGNNLFAALDALEDKIDRQLDKIHQKHVNQKGAQKPAVQTDDRDKDDLDEEDESELDVTYS
ncbi:MAG: ribosome hibernation-promoting factor, HPF/YfiA family [Pontibacterium sp.]